MLPDDLRVLVRGWLHGNCLLTRSGDLVDTGYHTGVPQLRAALRAHGGAPLARVVLTHVHSDHAGGVAALVAEKGARVEAHADAAALVAAWDRRRLWLDATGQELPRFAVDGALGEAVALAGRTWAVLPTGGHATGGVSLWCEALGVLVTGDALWEDGLGVLDPWVDGEGVYAAAWAALDRLEATGARVVVPGHGPPFTDLAGAVGRARSRVERWHRDRAALRRQVLRSGVGFWRLLHPEATPAAVAARVAAMEAAHP